MQDLSNLAAMSLATDSMDGGNQIWERSSMSAPGGVPDGNELGLGSRGSDQPVVNDPPKIEEITHTETVLHPEAPPKNKSPFPRPALGGPRTWATSGEENRGPAPWQQT